MLAQVGLLSDGDFAKGISLGALRLWDNRGTWESRSLVPDTDYFEHGPTSKFLRQLFSCRFVFFVFSSRFVFSCRICVFFAAVWRVFAGVLAGFCGRFAAHGTLRKIAAVCGKKRYENQNNQKKVPVRSSRNMSRSSQMVGTGRSSSRNGAC